MTNHYHAMNGEYGCMPDSNSTYDSYDNAVEYLTSLFDFGRERRRELKRAGYLDLNPRKDGASYCEIVECHEADCEDDND